MPIDGPEKLNEFKPTVGAHNRFPLWYTASHWLLPAVPAFLRANPDRNERALAERRCLDRRWVPMEQDQRMVLEQPMVPE